MIVVMALLAACEDEYFPEGFLPYQVEYMLTNDSSRTWLVTGWEVNGDPVAMASCSDSLRLGFEVITNDSIASYELRYNADCSQFDTTSIGALTASGSNSFTDSLYFERSNGTIRSMYVKELTSSRLSVTYSLNGSLVDQYLVPEN